MSKINLKVHRVFSKLLDRGYITVTKKAIVKVHHPGIKLYDYRRMPDGYLRVSIRLIEQKKRYSIPLHRLVWMQWKGSIPLGKEVNHKNGKKHKCNLSNLELLTHSQNVKHSYDVLGATRVTGEKHHNAFLSKKDILAIRKKYASGKYILIELARMYSVSKSQISRICRGERWAVL